MTDGRPVAVVGAGIMGQGIALTLALGGFDVRLHDTSTESLVRAATGLVPLVDGLVRHDACTQQQGLDAVARVETLPDLGKAVADAQLVIETVPEDIELKVALFAELDGTAASDATLVSNTSSLSITRMAAATARPAQVAGMHFFNPAHRMPLVEIVRGLLTDDRTLDHVRAVCVAAGKQCIVVADRPGFATSRLSAALGNEAFHMVMEGVASPEEIDTAAKVGLGHPMGPFELGDLIGLDTRLRVLTHLHATLGERFRPCPLLVSYVEAGRLGRKAGRGVYDYDQPDRVGNV